MALLPRVVRLAPSRDRVIERFTSTSAENEPCLESGCAVENEICLQALLKAGIEYHKACAAEWIRMFANPRNRIEVWKN